MRFAHLLLMFLVAVSVGLGCAADEPKGPLTKAEWAEDLSYLARELPKRHINPFREVDEATFLDAVRNLESRLAELQDHQIQVEFGRLVAMIGSGDGHTELYLPREGRGFHRLPIAVSLFGEDPRVYAAMPGYEDLLGARIVTIGGVAAGEAFQRVLPLIAHDNEVEFKLSAPAYLSVPEVLHATGLSADPTRAIVGFEGADGEVFERTLEGVASESLAGAKWATARSGADKPLYAQRSDERYWFTWLEDERTIYVSYRRCGNQKGGPSIKRFSRELFDFVDEHPVERFVLSRPGSSPGPSELFWASSGVAIAAD